MSTRVTEEAALRLAFQRLGADVPLEDVDLERVWLAVSRQLPGEDRRKVVEKVALDPSWALAWRVADELWKASGGGGSRSGVNRGWAHLFGYSGLAATLLLAVALGFQMLVPKPGYRDDGQNAGIESLVPEGQSLSFEACLLRWKEVPGATYELRVTSEDLDAAHLVSELKHSEYRVPEEFLSRLPLGTKLHWRVIARLPDGSVVTGKTSTVAGCR